MIGSGVALVNSVASRASGSRVRVVPGSGQPQEAQEAPSPEKNNWVSAAVDVASSVAGVAVPVAGDAAAKAARAAKEAGSMVANEAATVAVAGAANAKQWVNDRAEEFRKYIEDWVKQKIYLAAARSVKLVPEAVKRGLEDEAMPRCVSCGKDRLVDASWPHIQDEVLWELAIYLDGQATPEPPDEGSSPGCFRSFFRYHLYPHDKSFWRIIRDPVWWLVTLISMVPVHGISPLVFLFRFLIIDKADEFQLVQFILSFKGMQFITQGLLRAASGYFAFMGCVTAPAKEAEHGCEESGPGVYGPEGVAGIVGYFFTCLLVWIAFALIRYSTEKGRRKLFGVLAQRVGDSTVHQKGGLIVYFLWWDTFVLLVVTGSCAWVLSTRQHRASALGPLALDDWVFQQAFFAAQIVHGLLSAPFFFFTLPGLSRVLTHSLPTAYDRLGRCVPPKPSAATQKRRDELEAEPRKTIVTIEEANDLWNKIKARLAPSKPECDSPAPTSEVMGA